MNCAVAEYSCRYAIVGRVLGRQRVLRADFRGALLGFKLSAARACLRLALSPEFDRVQLKQYQDEEENGRQQCSERAK